jgi:hypothetical protein
VTVNAQALVLPDESLTEQFTMVVPLANVEPDGGLQTGVPTPAQLSVARTVNVTLVLLHVPLSAAATMFAGQVIDGACASDTVTVKLQLFVFPPSSVATQVTVLTPFAKVEPLGGTQTMPDLRCNCRSPWH